MPKIIAPSFNFIGNHPILDFINTKIVHNGKPYDLLESFADILDWLNQANMLGQEEVDHNVPGWSDMDERLHVVHEARILRSSLLTLVQNGLNQEEAHGECIEIVNSFLKDRIITKKIIKTDKGFGTLQHITMQRPLDIIAPIAETAVDFLCHYNLSLVKKCENPECVLYFYDNSKNSTRRWCSQKTCGNRMKVTAYLERQRNKGSL
ncbi:CGNR zinc finger domain-containing protein [Paenibacillus sepulcri]|uniref:CGNR zinc finger domain-containing protein n=1 Tax=Paenibacillus sepulcri TaxID=359917 RepID=A0ABS7C2Z2_9BACL|nr:CGNR zinc finger domain-containing protein [Paenibacillus sepulcri]